MAVNNSDLQAAQQRVMQTEPERLQYGHGSPPPAQAAGSGITDGIYAQDNQPAQNSGMSIVDQLSRTRTKDEVANKRITPTIAQVQSSEPSVAAREPRGRDNTETVTNSTVSKEAPSMALAPKSTRHIERSVSPGQLDDGSHVACSGERGEAYSPPTGLGKIKGKLHIGKH